MVTVVTAAKLRNLDRKSFVMLPMSDTHSSLHDEGYELALGSATAGVA